MGTDGLGRDEELGVVRENGDMETEGRGRDHEELSVVQEKGVKGPERTETGEELGERTRSWKKDVV